MGEKMMKVLGVVGMLVVVGGCAELWTPLPKQQEVDRARMPLEAVAVPGEVRRATPGVEIAPPVEEVKGVYQFTVPDVISQAQKQTGDYEQFLLYEGKPKPTDKPFLVITVGGQATAESEKAEGSLKATASRTYKLNGLVAKEWTGYTTDKRPYCEMIVTRIGAGDQLHAVAIVANERQRKSALEVLGSIEWKPVK